MFWRHKQLKDLITLVEMMDEIFKQDIYTDDCIYVERMRPTRIHSN